MRGEKEEKIGHMLIFFFFFFNHLAVGEVRNRVKLHSHKSVTSSLRDSWHGLQRWFWLSQIGGNVVTVTNDKIFYPKCQQREAEKH